MNPRVERIQRRRDIDPRVCGFVCLYGECFGVLDSTSDTLNPRFDIGYAQPSDSRRTVGSMVVCDVISILNVLNKSSHMTVSLQYI